ncbi:unnamed protein product [Moneuplotes crassus]|uniref:Uncharacterized protein n=1 Tax=Euplotes crassus TaxID=5936 RepID=A0AAD1UIX7_EUPCR|nr:unnamed protein product [Moneuplotes crassus]
MCAILGNERCVKEVRPAISKLHPLKDSRNQRKTKSGCGQYRQKSPAFRLKASIRKNNSSIPPLQIGSIGEPVLNNRYFSNNKDLRIIRNVPQEEFTRQRLQTSCTITRPKINIQGKKPLLPNQSLLASLYQTPKSQNKLINKRRNILNLSDSDFDYNSNKTNTQKVAFINKIGKKKINNSLSIPLQNSLLKNTNEINTVAKKNSLVTNLFIKGLKSKVLKIKRPSTQVMKRPECTLETQDKDTVQTPNETIPSSPIKKSLQKPKKSNFNQNIDLYELSNDQISDKALDVSNNEADTTKTIGVQIKVHNRKQYLSKYKGKLTKRNSSVLETEPEGFSVAN